MNQLPMYLKSQVHWKPKVEKLDQTKQHSPRKYLNSMDLTFIKIDSFWICTSTWPDSKQHLKCKCFSGEIFFDNEKYQVNIHFNHEFVCVTLKTSFPQCISASNNQSNSFFIGLDPSKLDWYLLHRHIEGSCFLKLMSL